MINSTDPTSIAAATKALRTGRITADYHPARIADLIDALAQAAIDQRAYIDELERTYMTPATSATLRTEYARGFRDAQAKMAGRLPGEEGAIMAIEPSFADASDGVKYTG